MMVIMMTAMMMLTTHSAATTPTQRHQRGRGLTRAARLALVLGAEVIPVPSAAAVQEGLALARLHVVVPARLAARAHARLHRLAADVWREGGEVVKGAAGTFWVVAGSPLAGLILLTFISIASGNTISFTFEISFTIQS